jgi:hypothetical protein
MGSCGLRPTITRSDRDALHNSLIVSLSAIGDIHTSWQKDDPGPAMRLWRRFDAELGLLHDLGWERKPQAGNSFRAL